MSEENRAALKKALEKRLYELYRKGDVQHLNWEEKQNTDNEIRHWEDIQRRFNRNNLNQTDNDELNELTQVRLLRTDQRIRFDSFSFETLIFQKKLLNDIYYNREDVRKIINSTELDISALLNEVINSFLPNNSLQVCYVVNKSFNNRSKIYSIRPIETHHVIKGREISICFDFVVNFNSFRFSLKRIGTCYNQKRRVFELEAELQIYINNESVKISKEERIILETYSQSQGFELAKRLEEWNDFLKWKKRNIENEQFWLKYETFNVDYGNNIITIEAFIDSDFYRENKRIINRLRDELILVADRNQSKSKNIWDAVKNAKYNRIGTLFSVKPKGQSVRDKNEFTLLEFLIDFSQAEEVDFDKIPDKGFLLNSIFGDLHMINIQENGIKRLQRLEAVNNHLTDFIFESRGAQKADLSQFLQFNYLLENLNDGQKEVVKKAILSPDLFLLQGPPGTGKTTTIAEICNYYCLQKKRVILASQSNLAVDNALISLIDKNYIYPMRIGSRPTEFGTKFLKNEVLKSWLEKIQKSCTESFNSHSEIVISLKQLGEITEELQKLCPLINSNKSKIQELTHKISSLSNDIKTNKEEKNRIGKDLLVNEKNMVFNIRFYELLSNTRKKKKGSKKILDFLSDNYQQDILIEINLMELKIKELDYFPESKSYIIILKDIISNVEKKIIVQDIEEVESYYKKNKKLDVSVSLEENLDYKGLMEKKKLLIDSIDENDALELIQINKQLKYIKESIKYKDWIDYQEKLSQILTTFKISKQKIPENWNSILSSLIPDESLVHLCKGLKSIIKAAKSDLIYIINEFQNNKEVIKTNLESIEVEIKKLNQISLENESQITKKEGDIKDIENHIQSIEIHDSEIKSSWDKRILSIDKKIRNNIKISAKNYNKTSIDLIEIYIEESKKKNEEKIAFNNKWGEIQEGLIKRYNSLTSDEIKRLKEIEDIYEANVNVLGLTCAHAGSRSFYNSEFFKPFDVVIVDEVSRATPPELLLPLLLGKKVVLMGDHRQLPPIFKERKYEEFEKPSNDLERLLGKYEKMFTAMLFDELYRNADISIKQPLQTQYRFHPQIMEVVNLFYQDNLLLCGLKDPDKERAHNLKIPKILNPNNHILWIDSSIDQNGKKRYEDWDRTSAFNLFEIELIEFMLLKLNISLKQQGYSKENKKRIGVITFYGAQIKKIRECIQKIQKTDTTHLESLELRYNTVDKFQGMERDIVIVSFVRTGKRVRDFVRNYNRINVAISRAKELLIIIGNAEVYQNYSVEVFNSSSRKESQRIYDKMIRKIKRHNGFLTPSLMNYTPIVLKKKPKNLIKKNKNIVGDNGKAS